MWSGGVSGYNCLPSTACPDAQPFQVHVPALFVPQAQMILIMNRKMSTDKQQDTKVPKMEEKVKVRTLEGGHYM